MNGKNKARPIQTINLAEHGQNLAYVGFLEHQAVIFSIRVMV